MKTSKRILSSLLVMCILFSSIGLTTAYAARTSSVGDAVGYAIEKGVAGLINGLLNGIGSLVPESDKFYDADTYADTQFYEGSGEFADTVKDGASWKLGSAEVSLVPDDWKEHTYYLGGYGVKNNGFSNKVEEILDDMKARVIAISDGEKVTVFATTDSIGTTNQHIRDIREKLIEKSNGKYDFAAINVCATHSHSGIDTEGLWTEAVRKIFANGVKSLLHIGKLESGTDPHYMEFFCDKVSDAMLEACENMESGTLKYTVKTLDESYFQNKNRASSKTLITEMHRFVFNPYNSDSKPTMIVQVSGHPDVAGYPTDDGKGNGRGLSGDYVYYMGEVINGAGYDFMFFNGAIAGVYMSTGSSEDGQPHSHRVEKSAYYGRELGRMALSLTLTEQQITADEFLMSDKNDDWYEGWEPVRERSVSPILNIALKEVDVPVTNGLIKLAGKLNLANYDVLKKDDGYYLRTEIGYMEMGDVKFVFTPGELCQDLVDGGTSLTAEYSFSGEDFEGKVLTDIFGDDIIVLGLTNDAIGYIVPDNDYAMCAFSIQHKQGDGHYHELISLGEQTASVLMEAYEELSEEIK
ncbi:MAG: hypothetical protein IJB86_09235 [Clostridia bacterium]|nr:hypothetical protein [Clostridia bacterium]